MADQRGSGKRRPFVTHATVPGGKLKASDAVPAVGG